MTITNSLKSVTSLVKASAAVLAKHSTSIIYILSLLVTGLLLFGFIVVGSSPEHVIWLYSVVAFLALMLIATVVFLAERP